MHTIKESSHLADVDSRWPHDYEICNIGTVYSRFKSTANLQPMQTRSKPKATRSQPNHTRLLPMAIRCLPMHTRCYIKTAIFNTMSTRRPHDGHAMAIRRRLVKQMQSRCCPDGTTYSTGLSLLLLLLLLYHIYISPLSFKMFKRALQIRTCTCPKAITTLKIVSALINLAKFIHFNVKHVTQRCWQGVVARYKQHIHVYVHTNNIHVLI